MIKLYVEPPLGFQDQTVERDKNALCCHSADISLTFPKRFYGNFFLLQVLKFLISYEVLWKQPQH